MLKLLALFFRLLAFKLDPPKAPKVSVEPWKFTGNDPAANMQAAAEYMRSYEAGPR